MHTLDQRWMPLLVLAALMLHGRSGSADEVHLIRGDVLIGSIVDRSDGHVVIDHPVLGTVTLPDHEIASFSAATSDGEPDAAAVDAGEAVPPESTVNEGGPPEAPPPPKPWTLNVDLGVSGSSGNTEDQIVRLGITAARVTPETRLNLDAAYYLKRSNSETTDNNFTGGFVHDWLVPESRYFWFADGRYDYDQFESWQHRIAGHGGMGYHLVQTDDLTFDLRGGVGGRREFGSDNDDLKLEGLLGTRLVWTIDERQSLEGSFAIFPVLTDPDDFRTRAALTWRMKVTESDSWNINVNAGLTHEYQAIVDPGNDRNDLRIFGGLGIAY